MRSVMQPQNWEGIHVAAARSDGFILPQQLHSMTDQNPIG